MYYAYAHALLELRKKENDLEPLLTNANAEWNNNYTHTL